MKNMVLRFFYTSIGLFFTASLLAQQPLKKLEQQDIASWKRIEREMISNNGRWVAYGLSPNEGDASLHVYDDQTGKTLDFPRGEQAAMSSDSRFLAFRIKPHRDSLIALRKKKVKKDELPGDTLCILDLEAGSGESGAQRRRPRPPLR